MNNQLLRTNTDLKRRGKVLLERYNPNPIQGNMQQMQMEDNTIEKLTYIIPKGQCHKDRLKGLPRFFQIKED